MVEREAEQATLGRVQEQLQAAKGKLSELVHAHARATADRDDTQRRLRAAGMELARHKLVVAHQQRQLERVRKENMLLRGDLHDLSSGRAPQAPPSHLPLLSISLLSCAQS